MFDPQKPLADLPLATMMPAELVAEIKRLAEETRTRGYSDYYNMRIGAIRILAELAREKMEECSGIHYGLAVPLRFWLRRFAPVKQKQS